jgi:hypothetical protein
LIYSKEEAHMKMVREVTIGFQGAGKKIERVTATVPAEWISGAHDALSEIYNNSKLRTRLSVAPGTALWAEISEPYDDSPAAWGA